MAFYSAYFICVLVIGFGSPANSNDIGYFWHVTDMHYDPTYSETSAGLSCNDNTQPSYGKFGDFLCDPPYVLIDSALRAMRDIDPNPDFVVWTGWTPFPMGPAYAGDDSPHIWNDTILNPTVVQQLVFNLTDAILETFPNHTVYAALGNHDWSPKSQLPPTPNDMYDAIAQKWSPWLATQDAVDTFKKGAYYAMKQGALRVVVLNTNLYYYSNQLTQQMPDPANQLQWLDDTLTAASNSGEKVMLVAHISPGLFEKHRFYYWYYPYYNDMFLALIDKHREVIGSMHFGHHHTDTFRVLYNSTGDAIQSFLLAPAVAPWETTLDGVMGGPGNNPAIRLVEYDRTTGKVEDIHQYYLHLSEANDSGEDVWQLEYSATGYYGQPHMHTESLDMLAQQLWHDDDLFSKYYLANGVRYDPEEEWDEETRVVHVCSMTRSHYDRYEQCYEERMRTSAAPPALPRAPLTALVLSAIASVRFTDF